ncbi:hypothetical protein BGX38DRAFT_1234184, partial [Terfezia claveryi]
MLPEDIGGILARTQQNIYSEALKPCDIPYLGTYLPTLIISAAVIPITWDFDHRTLDFLGDDYIQQCVADLHKSINSSNNTTYDVHCVRAYAVSALMSGNQRFELERAKKIDALARTIHDFLRPLGIIEGSRVEDYLRDAINFAAEAGLTFMQQPIYPLPRRTGCQPGDNFDPRFMIAEGIRPGSA